MSGTTTGNWQQYSRWLYVIARSMYINPPTGTELTAVETFVKVFWDTETRTGTRSWLEQRFFEKSCMPSTGTPGDPDIEPTYNDVKMLEVIARDVKKIPLTDAEKTASDVLIAATGDRRYGEKVTRFSDTFLITVVVVSIQDSL